jgi:hypothetical protein
MRNYIGKKVDQSLRERGCHSCEWRNSVNVCQSPHMIRPMYNPDLTRYLVNGVMPKYVGGGCENWK